MKSLLLFFLSVSLIYIPANAREVYRCVDEHGQTELTEKECEGGEKITLPAPQTYTPSPAEKKFVYTPPKKQIDVSHYDEVTITSPANDTTVRESNNDIPVTVSVVPALRAGYGHKLQLLLDGAAASEAGTSTSINLGNIERGSHTLRAVVLDANGNTLAESPDIIFHNQRFSKILHEKRIEQKKEQQKNENNAK